MSKRNPGTWEPPDQKPAEFAVTHSESALERIRNSTSPMAFSVAAQRAQAAGLEYGTSEYVLDDLQLGSGGVPSSVGGGMGRVQANFDNIVDDYQYRVAQALYKSGNPESSVELPDGTLAELYPEDMAILFIRAGRQMDHVDIQTFRSVRGLDDTWGDILYEAGY